MTSDARAHQLALRYQELLRQGRPIAVEDLCRDCPELLPRVRNLLAAADAGPTVTHAPSADSVAPPSGTPQTPTVAETSAPRDERETVPHTDPSAPDRSAARTLPELPGYEILGELGRGGMGVVYKARHKGLKRTVALKMILSGEFAGGDAHERFRSEAEAVARLQHPNIVQVYDIGDVAAAGGHDRLPYFSLEFVDGGSLAGRLANERPSVQEAAHLAETLARAMQHAHQKGIIHRDLKPANVLLTADGSPKITDFGLAKQMDADVARTHTGAVMGTPAYMAPEQAEGNVRAIGPLVDVYALGAILYELLTGRPPFRGARLLETLEQVRTQDPVPPSRHNRHVPHDLETICLKCLAKEPARRYASALALAQDLERFQAGEPILARREGLAGRLWRKVRRRPLTAALTPVVLALLVVGAVFGRRAWEESRQAARDRHVSELNQRLDQGLEAADWDAARLDELDRTVAELRELAPEQAEAARQRVGERFVAAIRRSMDRPNLQPQDVAAIERLLALLAERDAAAVPPLRERLELRKLRWDTVFELAAPFADRDAVFAAGGTNADDRGATLLPAGGPQVLTRVGAGGNVRLEATFDPSWDGAAAVGLLLNVRSAPDHRYGFEVGAFRGGRQPGEEPQAVPFREARGQAGGVVVVRILRDGVLVRKQEIAVPAAGPLRLVAVREGERLTFQVNDLQPVTGQDLFPPSGADPGVFGVLWPQGVRLQRLTAARQPTPPLASPLERGNDLYSRGDFNGAIAAYRELAASPDAVGAEVRYRIGLCHLALNQPEEARTLFERLAGESDSRWSLLASCQLWRLLRRQDRTAEADDVLDGLLARHKVQNLANQVPGDFQEEIVGFTGIGSKLRLVVHDPRALANAERMVRLVDGFQRPPGERIGARVRLVESLWAAGDVARARQAADEGLRLAEAGSAVEFGVWLLQPTGPFLWLLAQSGDAAKALEILDRVDQRLPGNPSQGTLIRARLHAKLGQWDEAERQMALYFADQDRAVRSYGDYGIACLMQGFLLERRGDAAGAREAWRRGLIRNWSGRLKPEELAHMVASPAGVGVPHSDLILGSLVDDLSQADVDRDLLMVKNILGADSPVARALDLYRPPLEVFREAYRTPRGKEAARRYAFLDLSMAELLRVPAHPLVVQMLVRQAALAPVAPDVEDALYRLVGDLNDLYAEGRFDNPQLLQLLLAVKGQAGALGWGGLKGKLPPNVRGPLACVLGCRYARVLNRPKDAEKLLRTACDDCPADSPLRRLAQSELDRLGGGKQ